MIPLRLDQLADVVGGELESASDAERVVSSVVIDSRLACSGALFVPLRGEHADGHDFVADAIVRGAAGYLREARRRALGGPGAVVVDDPGDALLGLGAWVRDNVDPVVVAVTGSVGKTTVKDFVAAAVGSARRVAANPGSYNNELGVPLTCCLLEAGTEVLVTEIGARGVGHVAQLASVVRPDVAVVTAASAAHLELFGDLATVARAKGELVEALGPDGVAVLNADDPLVAAMAQRAPGRVVTYGAAADADWRADDVVLDRMARASFTVRGEAVRLPVAGEHHVGNALAALAVADVVGVPLGPAAAALASARVSQWRMEVGQGTDGVLVLNDAYNANPASMAAALRALARLEVTGRRWAVLGVMAELGSHADEAHAEAGRLCVELGVDRLVVVGEQARGIHDAAVAGGLDDAARAGDVGEALAVVKAGLRPGDAVLVKASRSAGLEAVAAGLLEPGAGP